MSVIVSFMLMLSWLNQAAATECAVLASHVWSYRSMMVFICVQYFVCSLTKCDGPMYVEYVVCNLTEMWWSPCVVLRKCDDGLCHMVPGWSAAGLGSFLGRSMTLSLGALFSREELWGGRGQRNTHWATLRTRTVGIFQGQEHGWYPWASAIVA